MDEKSRQVQNRGVCLNKSGQVVLAGAGCSRRHLTAECLEEIKSADVIMYDDLIDDTILQFAGPDCRKIYTGKRSDRESISQDEINRTMIKEAKAGNKVLRLKGGDPFVFGRGAEEYIAVRKEGIPCRVIPGISSSVAVPENAGIPITIRKISRSFTVVTGHTADGTEEDMRALAGLKGTLVILMGLGRIKKITSDLIAYGKSPSTPAAVISNGFGPGEKRIDGTIDTIGQAVEKAEIKTPAIIVIGPAAAYHLSDEGSQGSRDLPVLVTGSRFFSENLSTRLTESGINAWPYKTIEITERDWEYNKTGFGWIVFTSANGVNIWHKRIKRDREDLRSYAGIKFACIGNDTEAELMKCGIRADFVPREHTALALGKELSERILSKKDDTDNKAVLILRASNGSAGLTDEFDRHGISYNDVKIYDTIPVRNSYGKLPECKIIVFGSASGVDAFFSNRDNKESSFIDRAEFVCMGRYTAERLRKYISDESRIRIAGEYSFDGIRDAVLHMNE